MLYFVMDGLRYLMKQTKACKMNFKQPQNEAKMSLKPTPRSKRNTTQKKQKKGGHLHRKNCLDSLGNVASKRVNTLEMSRKAA